MLILSSDIDSWFSGVPFLEMGITDTSSCLVEIRFKVPEFRIYENGYHKETYICVHVAYPFYWICISTVFFAWYILCCDKVKVTGDYEKKFNTMNVSTNSIHLYSFRICFGILVIGAATWSTFLFTDFPFSVYMLGPYIFSANLTPCLVMN